MTRQDYEIIAGTLSQEFRKLSPGVSSIGVILAAEALARAFEGENPRFNYSAFMERVKES